MSCRSPSPYLGGEEGRVLGFCTGVSVSGGIVYDGDLLRF